MQTDYEKIKNTLDSWFLNTDTNQLNIGYLNEELQLMISNDASLFTAVKQTEEPIVKIVYRGLVWLTLRLLNYEELKLLYLLKTTDLQKYFQEYDYMNPVQALQDTVERYVEERKNRRN